jgi:hypothetical protein
MIDIFQVRIPIRQEECSILDTVIYYTSEVTTTVTAIWSCVNTMSLALQNYYLSLAWYTFTYEKLYWNVLIRPAQVSHSWHIKCRGEPPSVSEQLRIWPNWIINLLLLQVYILPSSALAPALVGLSLALFSIFPHPPHILRNRPTRGSSKTWNLASVGIQS